MGREMKVGAIAAIAIGRPHRERMSVLGFMGLGALNGATLRGIHLQTHPSIPFKANDGMRKSRDPDKRQDQE